MEFDEMYQMFTKGKIEGIQTALESIKCVKEKQDIEHVYITLIGHVNTLKLCLNKSKKLDRKY